MFDSMQSLIFTARHAMSVYIQRSVFGAHTGAGVPQRVAIYFVLTQWSYLVRNTLRFRAALTSEVLRWHGTNTCVSSSCTIYRLGIFERTIRSFGRNAPSIEMIVQFIADCFKAVYAVVGSQSMPFEVNRYFPVAPIQCHNTADGALPMQILHIFM